MEDKLILLKEYKLFINRYEKLVINLNNSYKDIKTRIINTMYNILEDIYYTNLLEINKRKNYQRKIIVNIKMLDYYFYKLYKDNIILEINYNKINNNLLTILKLVLGWMKWK